MADLAHLADPNRAIEALAGSDALFSRLGGLNGDPAAAALAALPPLDLGSLTDIGDTSGSLPLVGDLGVLGALGGDGDALDLSSLLGSTSLAGGLPLDGLSLGGLGNGGLPIDGLPINGGVTSIVDTVTGALHLGQTAPGESTLDSVADLLGGGDPADAVTHAVGSTVAAVGHTGSGAAMALGEVGSVGSQPIEDTLNDVIFDIHTGIGTTGAANDLGLNGTVHGVIKLGNTIGLGELGGDNLLTDVVHLPGTLLSGGDLSHTVSDIVDHTGAIVPAVEKLVDGVVEDVEHVLGSLGGDASGDFLGNVVGVLHGGDPAANITNAVGNLGNAVGHTTDGVLNAVDDLTGLLDGNPTDALNSAIFDIHTGIGTTGAANDLGLNGTVHGVIKLGNTIGLGEIGGDNLLTDVVGLTGALGGEHPTDALGGVVEHVEAIVPAVEKVIDGVVEDLGALTGGGSLPLPLPTGGADSLVGTLQEAIHLPGGGLPEPVASLLGGDLGGLDDLGGLGGLGGLTDTLHLGTSEHHGGGLGLGLV